MKRKSKAPAFDPAGRTFYSAKGPLAHSGFVADYGPDIVPADEEDALLVGSSTGKYTRTGPTHLPAIDIDFPCQLVESSTPGHFHLYIDKEISQDAYHAILKALTDAGIVQRGFYKSAVRRGQTFLRKPGHHKSDDPKYGWDDEELY